jgi:hypothetical protein
MDFVSFLDAVDIARSRVIALDASGPEAVRVLDGRLAVALGAGFPHDSGIAGIVLKKGPHDPSLCRVVASTASALLTQAPLKTLAGQSPADVLGGMVFFIKDASPDSLLAALLLVARVAGVANVNAVFGPWIESVTNWDLGHMPEQPFRSWPALASALSHAHFAVPAGSASGSATTLGRTPLRPEAAWNRSFAFLIESMKSGYDPEHMPRVPGSLAVVALRRLEQVYEHTLTHATMLRLSVPVADSPAARVVVDTLVYVEDEPSDAVKIFGRTDAKRASGGRGFKLGVTYRPNADAWNQFTIHGDTTEGLDLTALWVELERRETEAYRQPVTGFITRAADKASPGQDEFVAGKADGLKFLPRGSRGPSSFQSGDLDRLSDKQGEARVLANVNNIWCNPWFLLKDASLIASPGLDEGRAEAGPARLTWEQVLDSLWAVFNPLSGIRVQARLSSKEATLEEIELLKAPAMDPGQDGPIFRYLDWVKGAAKSNQTRGIELNDSNIRILAALAEQPARPAPIGLANLPPRTECRLVMLNGGCAVLSNGGCIVVDDWHDARLNESEIIAAMQKAAEWKEQLDRHEVDLTAFNKQWKGESDEQNTSGPIRQRPDTARGWLKEGASYRLLGQVALGRSTLASQRVKAAASLKDANARLLYQELKSFWGLAERESYVDQGYQQSEASAKALLDARSARLLKYLAIYGFPAFVSSNFSKPLANIVNAYCVSRGWVLLSTPSPLYDALVQGEEAFSWIACTALLGWMVSALYRKWDPVLATALDR